MLMSNFSGRTYFRRVDEGGEVILKSSAGPLYTSRQDGLPSLRMSRKNEVSEGGLLWCTQLNTLTVHHGKRLNRCGG